MRAPACDEQFPIPRTKELVTFRNKKREKQNNHTSSSPYAVNRPFFTNTLIVSCTPVTYFS